MEFPNRMSLRPGFLWLTLNPALIIQYLSWNNIYIFFNFTYPVRCVCVPQVEYHCYREYKDLDLVSCIKFQRLQWAGQVQRLPLNCIPRKALKAEFNGNRPVERPRFKWDEGVEKDAARLLWCRNWKQTAQNRTVWRQKLWEAKAWFWAVVPYRMDGLVNRIILNAFFHFWHKKHTRAEIILTRNK
jgi:hypothetical protein